MALTQEKLFNDGIGPQMFQTDPPQARRLARTTHPSTSHESAIVTAKSLPRLQAFALEAIRKFPDQTQMELAVKAGCIDTRAIGRRISELIEAGSIHVTGERVCSITNRKARTYQAL